jgi:SAM-dependent methyltransferase
LADLGDFASKASGERYYPVGVIPFNRILASLRLDFSRFTFVDIGAGKGRAVLLASRYPFRQVIGVEHAPELHAIMTQNIDRYRSQAAACSPMTGILADATQFRLPAGPCLLFFFNPLKSEALEKVVSNLVQSYLSDPRRIVVLFLHPTRKNRVREIFEQTRLFKARALGAWIRYLSGSTILVFET